jgi:CRP-like cAMP-binding protein
VNLEIPLIFKTPMPNINKCQQNQILAALPAATLSRLEPALDPVFMEPDEVLHESGRELQYVYFPTTALISLEHGLQDGTSSEVAGIGKEGMLDVSLYSASRAAFAKAVVRIGGYGYRIKAPLMLSELGRSGQMVGLFLRYTRVLVTQVSLAVACSRHHTVEQQLCRWILLAHDRATDNKLAIPLERIIGLLGSHAKTIELAARALEAAGCISCHQDHIHIIDRAGLEARACECYATVRHELDRLQADTGNIFSR